MNPLPSNTNINGLFLMLAVRRQLRIVYEDNIRKGNGMAYGRRGKRNERRRQMRREEMKRDLDKQ
jgi:hypothetical protein